MNQIMEEKNHQGWTCKNAVICTNNFPVCTILDYEDPEIRNAFRSMLDGSHMQGRIVFPACESLNRDNNCPNYVKMDWWGKLKRKIGL